MFHLVTVGDGGQASDMMRAPKTGVLARLTNTARQEQSEYAGNEPRPLRSYLATLSAYGGLCAALGLIGRVSGAVLPERFAVSDLVLVTIATHKLSRILTKDPVTSPLRAPFTRFRGTAGPAELAEEVREHPPARHSVGELLTCPFCTAQWMATGFVFGLVVAPRPTRLAASVFTVVTGSDLLQLVYANAQQRATRG
ncbi:protein of unknown function DUF1360 [Frankia casuarinae]|jgi:hypothetical protein|uniref:DUF1360 domain-containing protein n=3 Tax=Frankiaceae TaxID=74712 RepID=Q2JAV7_FRACC|nr:MULTISPECIES: DUF1360 domain-containing protein [unclassified Frankia]ABD11585.1 protein of unknown function DUF1360 [Frankia casuarinae]